MNIDLQTSTLTLARDGLIALREAAGTRVSCETGALWITEDHERGDVILEAGQSCTIDRTGLTLIMALEPASLRLQERRDTLAARIGAWFARLGLTGTRPAII